MKKLSARVGLLIFIIVFAFSVTASASSTFTVVSKSVTYYNTISAGDGQVYLLPNASTSGTSVQIISSVAGTIKGHFEWQRPTGTALQLGSFTANTTLFNTGGGYPASPGSLVLVLERVADTTGAYPNVSYSVVFN